MEKKETGKKGYYTIDVLMIVKALVKRLWLIVVITIVTASAGFTYAKCLVKPTYSASILLYVNNSSISVGSTSFNISQLNAAQSLVKTYGIILNNKTTLERVIEKSGYNYTCKALSQMISSSSANGTEIMKVTVVSHDPQTSAGIANTIAEVLPQRVSEIVDGASMEVVDYAYPDEARIAPNYLKYITIGALIGAVLSILIISIIAMLDDTVHGEDYILDYYDYPILANIPNMCGKENPYYYYGGTDGKGKKSRRYRHGR